MLAIVSLYRVLSKIFPNATFGQKGLWDTEIQINQSRFISHTFFGFLVLRRTAGRLIWRYWFMHLKALRKQISDQAYMQIYVPVYNICDVTDLLLKDY